MIFDKENIVDLYQLKQLYSIQTYPCWKLHNDH